jgi:membrane protease YdiL (CAAX protease family)
VSGGRLARALLAAAVVAFWLLFAALRLGVGLPTLDAVLLATLLGLVPFAALAQLPLLGEVRVERLPAYWSSIGTIWLLGAACWLVGARDGGPAALGLVRLPVVELLAWSVGLTALGLAIILVFRRISIALGLDDAALLRELLPRSARERRVFVLLSVTAGVGEELAYRGYAIGALSPLLGPAGAAVLTSAVFGVVHGYQGPLGVIRAGLMGGALAWGFLASGSLWPAIVAHTLIDILAGVVLGERLLSPPRGNGVDQGGPAS